MTTNGGALAVANAELPESVSRRGITEAEWRTLCGSLYPGANPQSVLLVIDYCRARRLDPLKKPCHIVQMEVRDSKSGKYEWRDVVMPGIYELRTTAQRTGVYLGHSKAEYGPLIDFKGLHVPESCSMIFYRWNPEARERIEFPVECDFAEVVTTKDGKPNARWMRAPRQMLRKCTEAAGLREAFPDEIGGEHTAEEMDGARAGDAPIEVRPVPTLPKPEGFDDWIDTITAAAEQGAFEGAWAGAPVEYRDYLTATDPARYEALKAATGAK